MHSWSGGYTITIVRCLWPLSASLGRLKDNQTVLRSRFLFFFFFPLILTTTCFFLSVNNQFDNLQRGVQLFLQWAMMQGVAMLLQNRYQRQRLYTRIALGKVLGQAHIFHIQNVIQLLTVQRR